MHCHSEHGPHSVCETQTEALGCFVFGNDNQSSTQNKQGCFNYCYKRNTEVADKSKAKEMFVKTLSHCVRQGQNFAENAVVMLGCSEDLEMCKALSNQVKLKMQNNNSCEEFPATCNSRTVFGLCILLSVMLVCRIFVHISLFIFSLNLT
jgi:hypothetical protein